MDDIKLSTEQAAIILGVRVETVRRYVRKGYLKAKKERNGRISLTLSSFIQFLKEQELLKTLFVPTKATEIKMFNYSAQMIALVMDIFEEPTEGKQLQLFEVAWSILSTKFMPEYNLVYKPARSAVWALMRDCWGDEKFKFLALVEKLYYALEEQNLARSEI